MGDQTQIPGMAPAVPITIKEQIARDGNRWRVVVELTWDVIPNDVIPQRADDSPEDFARWAWTRIRWALDSVVGRGKPFAHYHIIERAHRCRELD